MTCAIIPTWHGPPLSKPDPSPFSAGKQIVGVRQSRTPARGFALREFGFLVRTVQCNLASYVWRHTGDCQLLWLKTNVPRWNNVEGEPFLPSGCVAFKSMRCRALEEEIVSFATL